MGTSARGMGKSRIRKVEKEYPGRNIRLIEQKKARGKGDSVHKGFEQATGDVVMILDTDLTVVPVAAPRRFGGGIMKRSDGAGLFRKFRSVWGLRPHLWRRKAEFKNGRIAGPISGTDVWEDEDKTILPRLAPPQDVLDRDEKVEIHIGDLKSSFVSS